MIWGNGHHQGESKLLSGKQGCVNILLFRTFLSHVFHTIPPKLQLKM